MRALPGFRRCKVCREVKPREFFSAHAHANWCDGCAKPYKHSEGANLRARLSKYGLSVERYTAMIEEQGGRCAICGRDFAETSKGLAPHVDHNHRTGAVRALLCNACNVGIGSLRDDPDLVERALDYLRAWEA
jgi:hypothetical protein